VLPQSLEILAAYMVRDGARQALKRYDPLDFQLDRMRVDVQGASVEYCSDNRIVLTGVSSHMRVEAIGFDTLRDLVIKVVPQAQEEAALAAEA
jgi:hypothetical protein